MARTNKYTSLNFNDVYEKKLINNTSTTASRSHSSPRSSSATHPRKSYSLSASSRLGHGGMLVLSRPSPKSQPSLPLSPSPKQHQPYSLAPPSTPPPQSAISESHTDSISLRPQGKTGGNITLLPSFHDRENNKEVVLPVVQSPKSDKFVPPHLRPGFVAREVTLVPEFHKPRTGNHRPGSAHGNYGGSPNRYAEDGRPKSGGGYESKMRGFEAGAGERAGVESDLVDLNRPRSRATRPSSSG